MKRAEKILLALGLVAFAVLAWKMSWASVGWALRSVGIGFVLILVQETVAHVLNTLGWASAFLPEHRRMVHSFWRLLRLRIAGDGVNYLLPSAIVAGELAKASMIGERYPISTRLSSLVVAKFTQILALALTSLLGLFFVVRGKVSLGFIAAPLGLGAAILGMLLLLVVGIQTRAWLAEHAKGEEAAPAQGWRGTVKLLDRDARTFLRIHPGLFALSVFFFSMAYLWGSFEAYWIARFLGVPISVGTAVAIEILSISFDGIFFMVPAKAGTQEVTKTVIFAALGLPRAHGFAFGLVRHVREITWALFGLLLMRGIHQPGSQSSGARLPSSLRRESTLAY